MRKQLMIACTAGMAFLSGGLTAEGQTQRCAPRDMVVDRLAEKYGESRQSMGLGANNAVIEVFASPSSGSWTITVTRGSPASWPAVRPMKPWPKPSPTRAATPSQAPPE